MAKGYGEIFLKNTFWVYLTKIITQTIALIVNIFVIVELDVSLYGEFNFIMNTVLIISMFSLGGINSVLNRYLPEFLASKDHFRIKKLINYSYFLSLSVFLVFLAFLIFWKEAFISVFDMKGLEGYFLEFIFIVVLYFLKSIIDVATKALLLHKKASIINMFATIIRSFLYIYFLDVLTVELLIRIEMIVLAFIFICEFIVFISYTKKLNAEHTGKRLAFDRNRIKRYGLFSLLNEIGAGIVGKASDYFIIGAMANTYFLGLYSFAFKQFEYVFKILPIKEVLSVIRPIFIQKFTNVNEDDKEFKVLFNLFVKLLLPIYTFPLLLFIVFGEQLIVLVYKVEYIEAYMLIVVMLLSNVIVSLAYPTTLVMVLKERMDLSLLSKSVIIFSIIGGILGMKYYGLIGVVTATVIGDFLRNLFIYILLNRSFKLPYNFKGFWNYSVVFIIPTVTFYYIARDIDSIFKLVLYAICFTVTYFLFNIYFNAMNKNDDEVFKRLSSKSKALQKVESYIRKLLILKRWMYVK
ncbi:hypothetical protein RQM59_13790 [Flavobacteriaceae bacterium S356]|uniref:Polysaccharide biosynthesis protein C-terminal domain-containing protein n=1 Tax=Asprobacillus argus TaxID=3076534 RepID=A0ABU3LIB9_9FLAO|nr:hypothetical protein [Flavobacteriaceae bacterium S356]